MPNDDDGKTTKYFFLCALVLMLFFALGNQTETIYVTEDVTVTDQRTTHITITDTMTVSDLSSDVTMNLQNTPNSPTVYKDTGSGWVQLSSGYSISGNVVTIDNSVLYP